MIGRIRGRLCAADTNRIEVMTAGGLGYDVQVPTRLIGDLPEVGQEIELHTMLVVRADALELYGFGTVRERELFRRLQAASGVGPKLALAVLGALPPGRIVRAIRGRDHASLQVVSGLGRKKAETIVVELTDKLEDLVGPERDGEEAPSGVAAVEALRALGYGLAESEEAVARARAGLAGREAGTEDLVRAALREI